MTVRDKEWDEARANEYRPKFHIPAKNPLELTKYNRETRHSRDDDEYEFVERNDEGELIARYEAWHRMSVYPPFTPDHGFKKFSPTGELIEEGNLA